MRDPVDNVRLHRGLIAKDAGFRLPYRRTALKFVAKILEVIRAGAQAERFFDHGKKIGQRPDCGRGSGALQGCRLRGSAAIQIRNDKPHQSLEQRRARESPRQVVERTGPPAVFVDSTAAQHFEILHRMARRVRVIEGIDEALSLQRRLAYAPVPLR